MYALVLVDFVNPLAFAGGRRLAPAALAAAAAAYRLKQRCRRARWPVVYANDNFGEWRSDMRAVVGRCLASGNAAAAALVERIGPDEDDLSVLKPRHSAFYGTPLDFILEEKRVTGLIVAGIAADSCVLFTALDAFVRGYEVWAPRDCVASQTRDRTRSALMQMRRAAKVWTGPSTTSLVEARAHCARLHAA